MQVLKRPQFLLDLAAELTWLKDKAGAGVAERWYQALCATVEDLKRDPHLGRERLDLTPKGIRSWHIKRFPRWLIFYTLRQDGALVLLRVRSGTMNLLALQMES
jgi:plasmid stabilization system protein ParE